nr:Arc family DNA-binding protein [uncultured Pseudomonas sp.]
MRPQYQTTDSRTADKFVIRLPDGLRGDISSWATSNERSMNSEIIHRLKCSVIQDQLQEEQAQMIRLLLNQVQTLEKQLQVHAPQGGA